MTDGPAAAVDAARLRRLAAGHRDGGRPLAAEQALRAALDSVDAGDDALRAGIRADYARLLTELGRDGEAATLLATEVPPPVL